MIIPQVVFDELQDKGAPLPILEWIENLPSWIEIQQTHLIAVPSLDVLDRGERDAILMAQELSADLLLVDDRQARIIAADPGHSNYRNSRPFGQSRSVGFDRFEKCA